MFDDRQMKREMLIAEYIRLTEFVYRASWSSADVEHFIFFAKDSRGYLEADFGIRNRTAEEFSAMALFKYGHPNHRAFLIGQDKNIACSMRFSFGRIDGFSQRSWPRIFMPDTPGTAIAMLVATCVKKWIVPIVRPICNLQKYFDFLIADKEPFPWFAVIGLVRAAQVVALGYELGLPRRELRQLLVPHDRLIFVGLYEMGTKESSGVDRYVDEVLSDWVKWSAERK